MGHSRPLFLYFRLLNTVDGKTNVLHKSLPTTGFEPWTSLQSVPQALPRFVANQILKQSERFENRIVSTI